MTWQMIEGLGTLENQAAAVKLVKAEAVVRQEKADAVTPGKRWQGTREMEVLP